MYKNRAIALVMVATIASTLACASAAIATTRVGPGHTSNIRIGSTFTESCEAGVRRPLTGPDHGVSGPGLRSSGTVDALDYLSFPGDGDRVFATDQISLDTFSDAGAYESAFAQLCGELITPSPLSSSGPSCADFGGRIRGILRFASGVTLSLEGQWPSVARVEYGTGTGRLATVDGTWSRRDGTAGTWTTELLFSRAVLDQPCTGGHTWQWAGLHVATLTLDAP